MRRSKVLVIFLRVILTVVSLLPGLSLASPPWPPHADFFRDSVNAALANAQNHKDGQRWLFVCSWSEWHEGSQIEPAQGFSPYPEILLDVLKEELDSESGG